MNTAVKQLLRIAVLAGVAAAPAAAQSQAMRFGEMDENKDGVITRREWRGSDRSFTVHDWNGDGILSGDEVRAGGRRRGTASAPEFDDAARTGSYADWTPRAFGELDHNRDGRISRDEWHFDREGFRRADHDNDGALSRAEFVGEGTEDDDRDDRFEYLDANNDGRIARSEWHGSAQRFDRLDANRDGALTRAEAGIGDEPPGDLFTSVDVNRDDRITPNEWHWSRASFNGRDGNRDGVLTRAEFGAEAAPARSESWKQGHARGLADGRQAGKEDKQLRNQWDLEGQRELESADAGFDGRAGNRAEYQDGYRQGFRLGYREGFGPR